MVLQNMTLDAFVMALACFLTTDNSPTPVYLNSQPNFILSNSTIGCQMQRYQVVNMRMRDLTMLKLQQEMTIKDLEYKVANLNATQQFNPILPATVRNLENQNQIQAAQITQYAAEVQMLKEMLRKQELSSKDQANAYQTELNLLKETLRNAGNSTTSADVKQLETEVRLLKEMISNHEESIDRQQNQIYRYESDIDELRSTISAHDDNYGPNYNPMPSACESLMRQASEQNGRLDEFKDKIEEIRVVIGNRLMGPGPAPVPRPDPNGMLNAMLNDCRNRVADLENVLRNSPGPNYGGFRGGHGGGPGGGHGGGHGGGPGGGHNHDDAPWIIG